MRAAPKLARQAIVFPKLGGTGELSAARTAAGGAATLRLAMPREIVGPNITAALRTGDGFGRRPFNPRLGRLRFGRSRTGRQDFGAVGNARAVDDGLLHPAAVIGVDGCDDTVHPRRRPLSADAERADRAGRVRDFSERERAVDGRRCGRHGRLSSALTIRSVSGPNST